MRSARYFSIIQLSNSRAYKTGLEACSSGRVTGSDIGEMQYFAGTGEGDPGVSKQHEPPEKS